MLVASGAGDRAGVFAPLPWLGGPELLSGSVALLLVAALGAIGVAAALRIFTAGILIGLFGALAALVSLLTSAAGAAAVLLSVLVCGIGAMPLLAIRFGGMPTPPVTLPAGGDAEGFTAAPAAGAFDAARERPDRATVFAAVARTEELLTGMLVGHFVLSACAFVVLGTSGALSARILIAVSAAALLLRSRLFVTVRQRVPLVLTAPAEEYMEDYPVQWALLHAYLQANYAPAGSLPIDGGTLDVLRDRRLASVRTFGDRGLPCFR